MNTLPKARSDAFEVSLDAMKVDYAIIARNIERWRVQSRKRKERQQFRDKLRKAKP
jgi:hypothetical protein